MGNPNEYLGNDDEVVQLPVETTPDTGWGTDEAVTTVESDNK